MSTTKERLWRRLRHELVKEGHILLRIRDERIVRYYESGRYAFVRPFSETSLQVFIGARFYNSSLDVRSAEGIPMVVEYKVAYTFDPRKAHERVRLNLTRASTVTEPENIFQKLMSDVVGGSIRHVLGAKAVTACYTGSKWHEMEQEIDANLQPKLETFGICLLPPVSLSILRISAPQYYENLVAFLQKYEMIRSRMSLLPLESIERQLMAEQAISTTLAGGGQVHLGSSIEQFGESITSLLENWNWKKSKSPEQGDGLDVFREGIYSSSIPYTGTN